MTADLASVEAELRRAGCVFAQDEARLLVGQAASAAELASWVARRSAGEPLEQLLGWAQFDGLRVAVAPGVFVPRRRTELLVRLAAVLARGTVPPGRRPVVLDLCCGTGAIGLALAARLGGPGRVALAAVDVEPAAVRCATRNLAPLRADVRLGDLYRPLPTALRGRVDLIVASPPYVPTPAIALMPAEARLHEPAVALDGGPDGLAVLRRVLAGAGDWLAPDGHLLAEVSAGQQDAARAGAVRRGLAARVVHSPGLDATVLVAARPPGSLSPPGRLSPPGAPAPTGGR